MLHTFIGSTIDAFDEAIAILYDILPAVFDCATCIFQCNNSGLYNATTVQVQHFCCSYFAKRSQLGCSSPAYCVYDVQTASRRFQSTTGDDLSCFRHHAPTAVTNFVIARRVQFNLVNAVKVYAYSML